LADDLSNRCEQHEESPRALLCRVPKTTKIHREWNPLRNRFAMYP
jgi:hypothetical protein